MAAPTIHTKRIIQTAEDSTKLWLSACLKARGGSLCNRASTEASKALLAGAGPCDQQNKADAMIELAKFLNHDADMIKFAQIYVQQPRDTLNYLSAPYCQRAPENAELKGLFRCQFSTSDPNLFDRDGKGVAVGAAGTIPFSHSGPLNPPGSCPANPSGPIPDGSQLVDITIQRLNAVGFTTILSSSLSPTSRISTAVPVKTATTTTSSLFHTKTATTTTSSLSHTSSSSASSSPTILSLSSASEVNSIPVSKIVIGITVLVITLLTAIILFGIWYVRRKRASANREEEESATIITPFGSDDKDLTLSLSSRALILQRDVDAGPAIGDHQNESYGLLPPNYDHVFNRPEDTFPLVASRRAPTYS